MMHVAPRLVFHVKHRGQGHTARNRPNSGPIGEDAVYESVM